MRQRKPTAAAPVQAEFDAPVIRNAEQWSREAERLADLLAVRDGLEEELRDATRTRKKEIRRRTVEIKELARALREGRENRGQGDLFQGEAEHALAAVHKRATEPIPTELHVFIPKTDKPGSECVTCGSNAEDPVHAPLVVTFTPGEMVVEGTFVTAAGDQVSKVVVGDEAALSAKMCDHGVSLADRCEKCVAAVEATSVHLQGNGSGKSHARAKGPLARRQRGKAAKKRGREARA